MCNILIVEDDNDLRTKVKEILNSTFPSLNIFDAADADGALKILSGNAVDIMVLDIRLPEKSGLWLIERIKPGFPETVFIVNSNYDSLEYRSAAFQRGANFFLSKKKNSINDITTLIESILSGSTGKNDHPVSGIDGGRDDR